MTTQMAGMVLLNLQLRQTAAWEPQSAGWAHPSLQQELMQGQKVWNYQGEQVVEQVVEQMT